MYINRFDTAAVLNLTGPGETFRWRLGDKLFSDRWELRFFTMKNGFPLNTLTVVEANTPPESSNSRAEDASSVRRPEMKATISKLAFWCGNRSAPLPQAKVGNDSGVLHRMVMDQMRELARQREEVRCYFHQAPQSDVGKVVDILQKAVLCAPDIGDTYLRLGRALVLNGAFDNAVEAFQRYTELVPEEAAGYLELGAALSAGRKHELALPFLQKAVQMQPDNARALRILGQTFRFLKRHSEALDAFRRFAELKPHDSAGQEDFGRSMLAARTGDCGIAALQRALELQPDRTGAMLALADALVIARRFHEAKDYLKRYVALKSHDANGQHRMGRVLAALGEHKAAFAAFRSALSLNPELIAVEFDLAKSLEKLNLLSEAGECLSRYTQSRPTDAVAHYEYGRLLMRQNRCELAISAFRASIALRPDRVGALRDLGLALKVLLRLAEAAETLSAYLKAKPEDVETAQEFGAILLELGQAQQACDLFQRLLASHPGRVGLRHRLGRALAALGRLQEAEQAFQDEIARHPKHMLSYLELGGIRGALAAEFRPRKIIA
jgi:tetratricopeptide (TPR) repeat protein